MTRRTPTRSPSRPTRATYRRRRAAVVTGATLVVLALFAFSWWAWQPADQDVAAGTTSPSSTTTTTRPTTTVAPTTAPPTTAAPTTVAPTTAPPTTAPPTTAAPVPAPPLLNVGPLDRAGRALPVVHRVPTTDPVVFLTVDDGVVRDPALIDFVRTRNIPLTMFLTQDYVQGGDYFEQLVALGSRAESHTISHPNLRGRDAGFQTQQICSPSAEYQARFGAPVRYFRPPYGNWDDTTLTSAAGCGIKAVVHWNATMAGAEFARSGGGPLQAGDIVLLHFKEDLVPSLQLLLEFMSALGLRPALLTDYLDAAPVP